MIRYSLSYIPNDLYFLHLIRKYVMLMNTIPILLLGIIFSLYYMSTIHSIFDSYVIKCTTLYHIYFLLYLLILFVFFFPQLNYHNILYLCISLGLLLDSIPEN